MLPFKLNAILFAIATAAIGSAGASPSQAEDAASPDFARDVEPLLRKYCAGCHGAEEQEGELRLDTFAELLKGGARGPAIVAGDSKISRMMRALRGEIDPKMPPEDEKQLATDEVALLERWIDAGAKGPDGGPDPAILVTPKLAPAKGDGPITALAYSPDEAYLAAARYGEVDIRFGSGKNDLLRSLREHPGKVNDLAFSSDGSLLLAASGVAGLAGEVRIWKPSDGTLVGKLQGHRDAILAVAISPDDKTIATGSYDKQIIVWDRMTGEKLHTLTQHNGAIFDLAFSPDGQQLASASADETVKIWNVVTGERLDTLGQPEGEQYAVLFSPDGERVIAAGADNRIRVWKFVSREKPEINPLLIARFAHEGAIVALAWRGGKKGDVLVSAADDGTLKSWEADHLYVRKIYEQQPDTPSAVAVKHNGAYVKVARLDGSLQQYELPDISSEPTSVEVAVDDSIERVDPAAPLNKSAEAEPNDVPEHATPLTLPATAAGVLHRAEQDGQDFDLYRFSAKKGQTWVLETNAARMKSPADTHIEVLAADGSRLERLKLQAVRDSYFTFRGKDSTSTGDFRLHNWEEMKLNQWLYANGEVVKLFMYPRGPDSGFNVYPNFGNRHTLFDTTSVSHDLGAPCYIVQPVWPGTAIIPNGLPVFPVYWENDDDAARKLGADSKLTFTAPADGEYLVRVKDRRGFQGESYKYELRIRPPRPDFSVSLEGANLTVNRGSGKMFKLNAGRDDNFDGEIRIDIAGVPPGFYVTTPITIQEGQWNAHGAIYAFADAAEPAAEAWNNVKLTATAKIDGKDVVKEIGTLGAVKLADAPKILATLSPIGKDPAPPGEIAEIEIQRGQTITATLRVTRNGYNDVLAFENEDSGRNLPHGVYVDNIGLNGVLLLADQNERTVFITADDWVPSTNRLFFLKSNQEDGQCTWPVRLIVK